MSTVEHFQHLQQLLKLERQADLEQYRQKVLARSLSGRVKEGSTWYPVRLNRAYIGTGERNVLEIERTNNLEQPHSFSSGKSVSVFSNASGNPEKNHLNGVVNYVRDNTMVITLNQDELPEWVEGSLLGVDVMFDEMSYREMEFALKKLMKAEDGRILELRELLAGTDSAKFDRPATGDLPTLKLRQADRQPATSTIVNWTRSAKLKLPQTLPSFMDHLERARPLP